MLTNVELESQVHWDDDWIFESSESFSSCFFFFLNSDGWSVWLRVRESIDFTRMENLFFSSLVFGYFSRARELKSEVSHEKWCEGLEIMKFEISLLTGAEDSCCDSLSSFAMQTNLWWIELNSRIKLCCLLQTSREISRTLIETWNSLLLKSFTRAREREICHLNFARLKSPKIISHRAVEY